MDGTIRKGRFQISDSPSKSQTPAVEEQVTKGKDQSSPKSTSHADFHGAVVSSLNALQGENEVHSVPAVISFKAFQVYQSTLNRHFSQLLQTHKEVMMAVLRQDAGREEQLLQLTRDNEQLIQELAQYRERR